MNQNNVIIKSKENIELYPLKYKETVVLMLLNNTVSKYREWEGLSGVGWLQLKNCLCVCVCVRVFTSCHLVAANTNPLLKPCHFVRQRSAVHRAVAMERILKKVMISVATFLGQPVRPISRILISYYGVILKEECSGHVRQAYTISS